MPPLLLPAVHYAASLFWLALAAPALFVAGPLLVRGLIFDPAVIAFVHMIMLGAVGSAIFGTLLQFIPVGLGVPLRNIRVGYWGFFLYETGAVTIIAGFWWWRGWLQALGWLLIFAAIGALAQNTLGARRHSVGGRLVGTFITVAHSAFGVVMTIGAARIGATLGWWNIDRVYLLAAHALFGIAGFGTLTAIGVGSRMLPTFLAGPGDDRRALVRELWITSAGLTAFAVGAVFRLHWVMRIGALTLLIGGVLASWLLGRWFLRRRRTLDAALYHVAGAGLALGSAVAIGAFMLVVSPLSLQRWAALIIVLIMGWLMTLVLGVMSKILTHITFVHLASSRPRLGARGSPNNLLRNDLQIIAAVSFTAGWLLFALGVWVQHGAVALAGAAAWCAGTIATLVNYSRVLILSLPQRG